ncbi:hypothetical protein [Rubritalea tangerina]
MIRKITFRNDVDYFSVSRLALLARKVAFCNDVHHLADTSVM